MMFENVFYLNKHWVLRLLLISIFVALLGGCANTGGKEYLLYKDSFATAHSVSQMVLDRAAIAERQLFNLSKGKDTLSNIDFNSANSRYYVPDIDPPITASLRNSFDIVNAYTQSLAALASGESAQLVATRVTKLGHLAVNAAGLADKYSAVSGLADELGGFLGPAQAIQPLFEFALKKRSQQEFQSRLLADYQQINLVLQAMQKIPAKVFNLYKSSQRLQSLKSSGNSARVLKNIQDFRVLMSMWVILIEKSQQALANAKATLESPKAAAGFDSSVLELEAAVKKMRVSLANLGQ